MNLKILNSCPLSAAAKDDVQWLHNKTMYIQGVEGQSEAEEDGPDK